mgnify:CR=1 FL=1
MSIIAKGSSSGNFVPCPSGTQAGVCVDVVDLGVIKNDMFKNPDGTDKWQHKINVVWESSETMDNGRPFLVSKRYTLSLGEKATLRHDLESWRGRPFTEDELRGFDVETILGVSALLNVVHKTGSKGGTFANVASVSPLVRGMEKLQPSGDYVRVCDRVPTHDVDDYVPPSDDDASAPPVDDIPF